MTDAVVELLDRLNRYRFRTALTMFSVAWGIFMLVLLLAAGKGLENLIRWEFRDDAINSIWIYPGITSVPYKGHAVGRRLRFTNADHAAVATSIDGVEHITSRFYLWGEYTITHGTTHGSFDVRSCHPAHQYIENTLMTSGRYLNDVDIEQRRKVTVIGEEVARFLFHGADPIGEYVHIASIPYRVVGVFHDEGSPGEMRQVYIPISTAQLAYGGANRVHQIMYTVGDASLEDAERMAEQTRLLLADRHDFDPDDSRALRVRNNLESFREVMQIISWINRFTWVVGIGTLLAGIVGVSNIMLVSVAERTKEIGLRKAIGATPMSIVGMILVEAVALTSVAGYAGMVAGIALVEAVQRWVPDSDYMRNPEVDLGTVIAATALLVLFGTLAGLFPALRAANIQPIEALRDA